jgi:hypothetical protein
MQWRSDLGIPELERIRLYFDADSLTRPSLVLLRGSIFADASPPVGRIVRWNHPGFRSHWSHQIGNRVAAHQGAVGIRVDLNVWLDTANLGKEVKAEAGEQSSALRAAPAKKDPSELQVTRPTEPSQTARPPPRKRLISTSYASFHTVQNPLGSLEI